MCQNQEVGLLRGFARESRKHLQFSGKKIIISAGRSGGTDFGNRLFHMPQKKSLPSSSVRMLRSFVSSFFPFSQSFNCNRLHTPDQAKSNQLSWNISTSTLAISNTPEETLPKSLERRLLMSYAYTLIRSTPSFSASSRIVSGASSPST